MPNDLLYKNLTPLSRAVNAAIMDMHEDKGRVEQSFYHWGARGVKKLNNEWFKSGRRRVLLQVNKNTWTATLPPDFDEAIFVGFIAHKNGVGYKVPIAHNSSIVADSSTDELPCDDKCPKCKSSISACNDLQITVDTTVVVIDGTNYDKTITKKLYPNGDYFLESSIPYKDQDSGVVIYHTSKEFITHLDLKPCGCVETTESNLQKIEACNPEVYCNYYAPFSSHTDEGEYEIFPEQGIIQLNDRFRADKLYLEYKGFLLKINGQYQIPSIAFETLVEWIKYKYISGKLSVSRMEKLDQWNRYKIENRNMKVVSTRTSMSRLLNAILRTPKFDIYIDRYRSGCSSDAVKSVEVLPASDCSVDTLISNTVIEGNTPTKVTGYVPYTLAFIVGVGDSPVSGSSTYQSPTLKGALNLDILQLNDTTLTRKKGDFTFDPATGIIDISPNKFLASDVVVGGYFKLLP